MAIISRSLISFCILLVVGAASVSAQVLYKRGEYKRQVPEQPSPQIETRVDPNAIAGTVEGTIRWSQVIGLPPMYPGASEPYPAQCGLIVILAKKTVGHAGSFGQFEVVGRANSCPVSPGITNTRRGYGCSYTINGLPKETSLLITAEFIDTRTFDTEPWISALTQNGRSQPPAGSERVFTGGGSVTLTNDRPTATIDFGIGYAPKPRL